MQPTTTEESMLELESVEIRDGELVSRSCGCVIYMREPGRLGALPGAGAAPLNGRGVESVRGRRKRNKALRRAKREARRRPRRGGEDTSTCPDRLIADG